jgi:hypothetical protein
VTKSSLFELTEYSKNQLTQSTLLNLNFLFHQNIILFIFVVDILTVDEAFISVKFQIALLFKITDQLLEAQADIQTKVHHHQSEVISQYT